MLDSYVFSMLTSFIAACFNSLRGILKEVVVNISPSHLAEDAREVIRSHLDRNKWQQCAFAVDQFRSSRWLLHTAPKMTSCPSELRRFLTVSELSQTMHLKLVVHAYSEAGRRLRPSARSKMRLSTDGFEKMCDFACMYANVLIEARGLATWSSEKEEAFLKAFFQKTLAL